MIHDYALMIHYEKCDQKCIYRFVNLLYFKHSNLLHVLATCCGHLQGGVL